MPVFLKAQVSLNMGLMYPKAAKKEFNKAIKYIEKSKEHLTFEPDGSFGFQLNHGCSTSLQQLRDFVNRMTI